MAVRCSWLFLFLAAVSCAEDVGPGLPLESVDAGTGPELPNLVELWTSGLEPIPPQRLIEGDTRYPVNLRSYGPGDSFWLGAIFDGLSPDATVTTRVIMNLEDENLSCFDEGEMMFHWSWQKWVFNPWFVCPRRNGDDEPLATLRFPLPPAGTLRVVLDSDRFEAIERAFNIRLCPTTMRRRNGELLTGDYLMECNVRGPD